ncbi:DUF2705 family protein [Niallia sp. 01092]|uniref:DUF2705 family protein n=1 Tax=unclassified Niallia TaxID=2837522 RepID=UPI003FD27757
MKGRSLFFIILIAFTLQCWMYGPIIAKWYPEIPDGLNFFMGIPLLADYRLLMFWYLSFVSISFYFSGNVKEVLNGYGQYLMVRNYNRVKWIILRYFWVAIKLMALIFIQSVVSYYITFFFYSNSEFIVNILILKAILMYYITFLFLLILQLYLELYFSPQIAFLSINTYVVGAIIGADLMFKYNIKGFFIYLLIPNYAMGSRLNIFSNSLVIIHYIPALITIITLIGIVLIFSVKRIKSIDFL